jgi:hypothetical protein
VAVAVGVTDAVAVGVAPADGLGPALGATHVSVSGVGPGVIWSSGMSTLVRPGDLVALPTHT